MDTTLQQSRIRVREGEEILNRLAVACSDSRVYSEQHPRYLESCQSFLDALSSFFETHEDQRQVLFVYRNSQIWFRKLPVAIVTPPTIKLSRLLKEKGVEGLRFAAGCNLTAMTAAISALYEVDPSPTEPTWKSLNCILDKSSARELVSFFADEEIDNVANGGGVLVSDRDVVASPPGLLSLPQLKVPLERYQTTLATLHDLMGSLGAGGNPGFGAVIDASHDIAEGVLGEDEAYLPLTTVEYSDHFTFNHSVNVCVLAVSAFQPLVGNPEKLAKIGQAALLHDLGKSLVSEDLFYANRPLQTEELLEIKRHAALGAQILQDTKEIDPMSVMVAHDHHRRTDGEGYPPSKESRSIDVVTALVAAADILEALMAERPYKPKLSTAEAFEIFAQLPETKGLEIGARLLFDTLSPFPTGSFVELSTGDVAVVSKTHRDAPGEPIVRVVDSTGVPNSDEIDLRNGRGAGPRIRRASRGPTPRNDEATNVDLAKRLQQGDLLVTEG